MQRYRLPNIASGLAFAAATAGCHSPAAVEPTPTVALAPDAASMNATPLAEAAVASGAKSDRPLVILFVWDGLRPDSVDNENTPELARLAREGASFSDHHAAYPTFTMINAAALATGSLPAQAGFFGNTVYRPDAKGKNADGAVVDFSQPVFTEDAGILQALARADGDALLTAPTLFTLAQEKGLRTFALGKSGPAFLQDYRQGGEILDEKLVWPRKLADDLKKHGVALPKSAPIAFADTPDAGLTLAGDGGLDPTNQGKKVFLEDGVTPDPSDRSGSRQIPANDYLMSAYLDYILPERRPDLSVLWLRNPDSTEHDYGPGTENYRAALRSQDGYLGRLRRKLQELGLESRTNLLVVSDHGHSTVSGPLALFPLRGLVHKEGDSRTRVGSLDPRAGSSVSGDVRLADLLTRAGFHAFDGGVSGGCALDPVLSGITASGKPVYPQRAPTGSDQCPPRGDKPITTAYFRVPSEAIQHRVIVAANGGSEYLYLPEHEKEVASELVRFLQSRQEIGPIFVASRYGALAGTLSLRDLELEDARERHPDMVVSYSYDEGAAVSGMKGISYESMMGNRGMHGSFSPVDVHNTLIAYGPGFRRNFSDPLPSANVDVAPTVAALLGLSFSSHARGRVLHEALAEGAAVDAYAVKSSDVSSHDLAKGIVMRLPIDPDGHAVDTSKRQKTYGVTLFKKTLTYQDRSYEYYDRATATRH